MKAKICRFPSCNVLIKQNEVYCAKHIQPKKLPFEGATRYNTELYNTSKWRKLRAFILKNQPYCNNCGATEKLEIHHRIQPKGNPELFYDESNLVPLCGLCHKNVTAREIRSNLKR